MIDRTDIIYKLYANVVRTSGSDESDLKAFDKDDKEVTLDFSAINTEFTKQDYQNKRVYPLVLDQLDQIYWDKKNGTIKLVEAIDKVKSDNPKP